MTSLNQDYDYLFKLLLIGNSAVGKSSLLLRFSDNVFNDAFLPTIGVDFKIRTFDIQGKTAKLQIWDTAGQERFKTITKAYYKGAHGIILVYDITDEQSFKDLENWLSEVEKHASANVVRLLVGNKCDLEKDRKVTYEQGEKLAKQLGIKFLETSAKNSTNVEETFLSLAQQIKQNVVAHDGNTATPEGTNKPRSLEKQEEPKAKQSGCC